MIQKTLSGTTYKNDIEQMLYDYDQIAKLLNTNKSLMLSPLEFMFNRKKGRKIQIFKDSCILYQEDIIYGVIGKAIDKVNTCKYSIKKPNNCRYKTKKEYIYDIKKILNYKKDKTLYNIKRLCNKYEGKFQIKETKNIESAKIIYEKWKQTEGKKYFQIHDTTLHNNIFKYWEKIKEKVLLYYLKDNKKTIGYIILEKTDKKFIYLMIRKVLSEYIGVTTYFHVKVMEDLYKKGYKNVSDGGADKKGLKFYKEKFRPHILKTYSFRKV